MDPEEKKKRKGVIGQIAVYTVSWGFACFDRLIIAMLLPFLMPAFGLNLYQGGLIVTMMAIGYLAFVILGGAISDKIGRRRITLPAIVIFSVLSFVTGFMRSIAALFVVRTVVGASEGAFSSSATAHIGEIAPPDKRGAYMGPYNSAFGLFGSFLAPLYAMNVAAAWGWEMAFYLTIIPGVALVILALVFVKESPRFVKGTPEYEEAQLAIAENKEKAKVPILEVLKVRNIGLAIAITMTYFIWNWSWLTFGTTFFVKVGGFSDGVSGTIMSMFGLGGFVGCVLIPRLSDNWGRRTTIPIMSALGYVFTLLTVFGGFNAVGLSVCLFLASFFAWGAMPCYISALPMESVKPEWTASAIGLILGFGELVGIAVAPPLLGFLGDMFNLNISMFIGSFGLIAVIILSLFLKETAPNALKRQEAKRLKTQG